ncbi:hypothetical protein [Saccharopolyspora cebuensis]|uniref:Uncharacterized protein n=1 Tax=Saccharopolyspora cebuensis TaxID=418759 RepID=A0ABV4CEF9_9PSEU
MDVSPRPPGDNDLPTLLAEYGHLAAQLPGASRRHEAALQARLAELDRHIDRRISELPGDRPAVER